jgi:hypothetical protein
MVLENGILKIILSDPTDSDTIQKLQFILNKNVQPVLALRSRATSVHCCALGSASRPRFGGYNDRSRVVMRSAEDQKVQAAQESSFPFRGATPRLCNALSVSACEAPAPEIDSF